MGEKTATREPKQTRSIQTKEKILDTAYQIFCSKGYYATTTNDIAKQAGVPIGSLYSYFRDKDTIFMEILRRYHSEFEESHEELSLKLDTYLSDPKAWIRHLMENLIRLHENGKELNREMQILVFSKPEVAELSKMQMEGSRKTTLEFLYRMKDVIRVKDIEAAAIVSFDTISAVVHRIVFNECEVDRERIISACVEEVYKYLVL